MRLGLPLVALLLARAVGLAPTPRPLSFGAARARVAMPRLTFDGERIALVLLRDGEDAATASDLLQKLGATSLVPQLATDDASALELLGREAYVGATFEMRQTGEASFRLMEAAASCGSDFYRWQPSSCLFRRLAGQSGPAFIAPRDGFEAIADKAGLGFLDGDEEPVVDVKAMNNEELARFLGLPAAPAEGDLAGDAGITVGALGYSLESWSVPRVEARASGLRPLAREVALCGATEPAYTYTQADGAAWPDSPGADGVYVSALSGAPLYESAHVSRGPDGWPSGSAPAVGPPEPTEKASARAQLFSTRVDASTGQIRTELSERSTGAHLGHRFDGTTDCVNSASFLYVPRGDALPAGLPPADAPAVALLLATEPRWLGRVHVATLACGCFWGVRAALADAPGVRCALAGFYPNGAARDAPGGGRARPPTYEDVCAGGSGHVEAVQLAYDPEATSYAELLSTYWALHDPTSLYRQGADAGEQYASAVFYHSDHQREVALASRREVQRRLDEEGVGDIVTVIRPAAGAFVAAGPEHQRGAGLGSRRDELGTS